MNAIISNTGYCCTCDNYVTFSSHNEWLRDHYICENCRSIPRERALFYCIEKFYPNWAELAIHESSPANRGASFKLKNNCKNYQATQFFPHLPLGWCDSNGWKNENLENQTFPDESFDLVITQDVMEHVFDPAKAFGEIARTLKSGGAHIFTVPLVNKNQPSQTCAVQSGGETLYLKEPEYHGNPISEQGSLVVTNWGYDICDFIFKNSGLYTFMVYTHDVSLGIEAEYIEVLISRKI